MSERVQTARIRKCIVVKRVDRYNIFLLSRSPLVGDPEEGGKGAGEVGGNCERHSPARRADTGGKDDAGKSNYSPARDRCRDFVRDPRAGGSLIHQTKFRK